MPSTLIDAFQQAGFSQATLLKKERSSLYLKIKDKKKEEKAIRAKMVGFLRLDGDLKKSLGIVLAELKVLQRALDDLYL